MTEPVHAATSPSSHADAADHAVDDANDDAGIAFDPVATGARHDGWTAQRQRNFIDHLERFGGVAAAARAVGMTKQSAYRLRRRADASSFAAAWDVAHDSGRQRAYDIALDRGVNGYTVPVRRAGRVVGHRHVYDNRLLFAACYGMPMRGPRAPWEK